MRGDWWHIKRKDTLEEYIVRNLKLFCEEKELDYRKMLSLTLWGGKTSDPEYYQKWFVHKLSGWNQQPFLDKYFKDISVIDIVKLKKENISQRNSTKRPKKPHDLPEELFEI